MNKKMVTFIPPKCDLVKISKRKIWHWKFFEVLRSDGKEYWLVGKSFSYNKDKELLTIKLLSWRLPVMVEIKKEFLIDNTKNNDK